MSKFLSNVRLSATIGVAITGTALAHHSYQMFDTSKEVSVTGTMKAVEWTNPHVWFQLAVENPSGPPTEFAIEAGGISAYGRLGWHKKDVPIGAKVVAVINPLRNGDPGGNLVKITFPNGAVLSGRDGTAPDGSPVKPAGPGGPP